MKRRARFIANLGKGVSECDVEGGKGNLEGTCDFPVPVAPRIIRRGCLGEGLGIDILACLRMLGRRWCSICGI